MRPIHHTAQTATTSALGKRKTRLAVASIFQTKVGVGCRKRREMARGGGGGGWIAYNSGCVTDLKLEKEGAAATSYFGPLWEKNGCRRSTSSIASSKMVN